MKVMVNEVFASVQGEGVNTGLPTLFIRLSGCNLDCRWCDTSYARSLDEGKEQEIEKIVREVLSRGLKRVCITGGEPLIQKGTIELSRALIGKGLLVDIETNGSLEAGPFRKLGRPLMLSMDVKTPSSGECGSFLISNLPHLLRSDQLKFIIKDLKDLDFTFSFLEEHRPACSIILTPCDNMGGDRVAAQFLERIGSPTWRNDRGLRTMASRMRLMVQTHKVLWRMETRGV